MVKENVRRSLNEVEWVTISNEDENIAFFINQYFNSLYNLPNYFSKYEITELSNRARKDAYVQKYYGDLKSSFATIENTIKENLDYYRGFSNLILFYNESKKVNATLDFLGGKEGKFDENFVEFMIALKNYTIELGLNSDKVIFEALLKPINNIKDKFLVDTNAFLTSLSQTYAVSLEEEFNSNSDSNLSFRKLKYSFSILSKIVESDVDFYFKFIKNLKKFFSFMKELDSSMNFSNVKGDDFKLKYVNFCAFILNSKSNLDLKKVVYEGFKNQKSSLEPSEFDVGLNELSKAKPQKDSGIPKDLPTELQKDIEIETVQYSKISNLKDYLSNEMIPEMNRLYTFIVEEKFKSENYKSLCKSYINELDKFNETYKRFNDGADNKNVLIIKKYLTAIINSKDENFLDVVRKVITQFESFVVQLT